MAAASEIESRGEPAAGLATIPTAELHGAALDEALRQARQASLQRAKCKFLDDTNAGRDVAWDPSWDQLSTQQETTSKRVEMGNLKPFKGKKYSEYENFMKNLDDRFAVYNIRSVEDQLRMAASYLDDNFRIKWHNHLLYTYDGEVRNVSSFAIFKEWLRSYMPSLSERRRWTWEGIYSIQQKETESYDKYSDRFDALIRELPEKLDEANIVTLKITKMRADLRQRTYAFGDPLTLKDLAELARKAESFIPPIAAPSAHTETCSVPSAPPTAPMRKSSRRPSKAAFSRARTNLSTVRCYNCGDYGHYRAFCPRPKEWTRNAPGDHLKRRQV